MSTDFREIAEKRAEASRFRGPNGEEIPLKCGDESLFPLGAGVVMYLKFLKSISYFLLALGVLSIPALFVYGLGHNLPPTSSVFIKLSMGNVPEEEQGGLLGAFAILSTIAFLLYIRYLSHTQKTEADYIEGNILTSADFSVKIQGLPKTLTDPRAILPEMSKYGHPVAISLSMNIGRIWRANEQIKKLKVQLEKQKASANSDKVMKTEEKIKRLEDQVQSWESSGLQCTGVAFVTFEMTSQAKACIMALNKPLIRRVFARVCGSASESMFAFARATRPSEPVDIMWENLETTIEQRYLRRLLSFLASGLCIGVTFGLIIALSVQKRDQKENNEGRSSTAGITFVISLTINALNRAIAMILQKLSTFERHHSRTNEDLAVVSKLTIAQYINSALVILFVTNLENRDGFFAKATDVIILVIMTNAGTTNMIQFMQKYIGKAKGWMKLRKAETQEQFNEAMALPEFSLRNRYAYVLKTVFLCFTYAGPYPVVYWVTVGGLMFTFWVDKRNLLRVCAKPRLFDSSIAFGATDLFIFAYVLHRMFLMIFLVVPKHGQPVADAFGVIAILMFVFICVWVSGRSVPDLILSLAKKVLFCCCGSSNAVTDATSETFTNHVELPLYVPPNDSIWAREGEQARREQHAMLGGASSYFRALTPAQLQSRPQPQLTAVTVIQQQPSPVQPVMVQTSYPQPSPVTYVTPQPQPMFVQTQPYGQPVMVAQPAYGYGYGQPQPAFYGQPQMFAPPPQPSIQGFFATMGVPQQYIRRFN